MKFKIFGREPTLILETVSGVLAFLVTFGWDKLTAEQAGAIVALIAVVFGLVNAWAVRPVSMGLIKTFITVSAALLSAYGLDFSQEKIGALQMAVVVIVSLLVRGQVTPAADPMPTLTVFSRSADTGGNPLR